MSDFRYSILFISKNDYNLLENWLKIEFTPNFPSIINLDIGSNEDQKINGLKICSKFNIEFLQTDRTEMQINLQEVIDKSERLKSIDYLLYLHTDCFTIDANTFCLINSLIENNDLSRFGCIGFNIYHDEEIQKINSKNQLMTTGRGCLQKGNGWYNSKNPIDSEQNRVKAFAVESVMWCAALLNKNTYISKIKPDQDFNFFHAFDDIAYQFMLKNIYNVVIPHIRLKHDQSVKEKLGYNKKSPIGNKKEVIQKYGRIDHHFIWYQKYGFHWNLQKHALFPKIPIVYKILSKLIKTIDKKWYLNMDTVARKEFITSHSANYKILKRFYDSRKSKVVKVFDEIKISSL